MKCLLTIFKRNSSGKETPQTIVGVNVVALKPAPSDEFVLESGSTVTRKFVDQALANTFKLMHEEQLDQDRHFIAREISKFVKSQEEKLDQEGPVPLQQ